jgi:hypothetical protein
MPIESCGKTSRRVRSGRRFRALTLQRLDGVLLGFGDVLELYEADMDTIGVDDPDVSVGPRVDDLKRRRQLGSRLKPCGGRAPRGPMAPFTSPKALWDVRAAAAHLVHTQHVP